MSKRAADALARRLLKREKDVVDVAYVEFGVFFCDLVGAPPARFVLFEPGSLIGCKLGSVHELILARHGSEYKGLGPSA
jgi:hypothetical protein